MKLAYKLLGLVLLISTVQADSITTIKLSNRQAQEIIPIIKPMLGSEDAITGQCYNFFFHYSATTEV